MGKFRQEIWGEVTGKGRGDNMRNTVYGKRGLGKVVGREILRSLVCVSGVGFEMYFFQ